MNPEALAALLPQQVDLRETLATIERTLILRALDSTGGVQAEAARSLELSRSDFGYKLAKYTLNGSTRASETKPSR